MKERFNRGNKHIYNINYHIIWCPKYRKHILTGKFKEIILSCLYEKQESLNIKIEKCEIMPDHIHLFIKSNPLNNISKIVQVLKGYSSFKLRSLFPKSKKYKHLWSRGYYCESIGHISEETIKKYIDDQWKH
jgi:putative transposase